jgi:hypothetical protein
MKMGLAYFIPVVILLSQLKWRKFNRWNRRLAAGTSRISVLALGILLSFLETLFF